MGEEMSPADCVSSGLYVKLEGEDFTTGMKPQS